ncbi:MAG TPA: lysophospholipid acyltransferase family protein [Polyangiaceae bacterium]|nr:lysophospholipid acyltransferase family protein [Polyangiaceae bacterium]
MNDVREGGTWTRRQRAKNALIRALVRGALFVADRLPESALASTCRGLARTLRFASPRLEARGRSAAARCLPAGTESRVVKTSFARLGENLATTLALRKPGVRALSRVKVDDADRNTFDAALSLGRGVVFVSAHHGPFELLAAAIAELGYRPAVVVRESYDPELDPIVDRHRTARGVEVIHRGRAGAATRIVRALRDGRPVGFLPDFGGRVPKTDALFLGRRAPFAIGPQHLALRLGVPLVVGVLSRREGAREGPDFSLRIRSVGTDDLQTELLTQRVARTLEEAILESPTDFPWFALPVVE